MDFKKGLIFISLLFIICISLSAVSATDNINDNVNTINDVDAISVVDVSDDNVVTNVSVVNTEDNKNSINFPTKNVDKKDITDVSAKMVDTQNKSVSKVSMYSDWDVYFYSDSITTRYHSSDYYYFGWSGYFDGYFEVYDEYWDCVHREYLYGYNGNRKWKTSNLDGTGTYTVEFVDYNGELLDYYIIKVVKSSIKISCKSFTTNLGTRFTCYAYVTDKYEGFNYDGGTVKFKIAGETYKATLKNGVAKVTFKVKGKTKKYKCEAIFSGGSNVYGSSKTFYMTVKPKKKIVTTSISTKLNRYVTKYKNGYKIQSHKFKAYLYQQVSIFIYKKGHMLNNKKYAIKVHYKRHGKWRWTHWVKGCISATYNNIKFDKSDVIGKVYVKFIQE